MRCICIGGASGMAMIAESIIWQKVLDSRNPGNRKTEKEFRQRRLPDGFTSKLEGRCSMSIPHTHRHRLHHHPFLPMIHRFAI